MSVRLLSAGEVDRWRAELAAAMVDAQAAMKRTMGSTLRANGLTWDSPVKSVPAQLWSQGAWVDMVGRHVEPAARKVAVEIQRSLRARVDKRAHWGLGDVTPTLVSLVTNRAIQGGPYIGSRLGLVAAGGNLDAISRALDDASSVVNPGARYGGVQHPSATPTILDEYQARFDQLNDLAANVAGAMSNAAVQLLAETAADAGPGVEYVWNCAMIETSRDDHVEADGQTQPAGEPFDVGGESLMYPGDPAGSDEQTCNCLCWLEVEGVDLSRDFEASLASDVEE